MARTKSVRGSKIPVRFSSDPGKNEEKVGTRVVEYLQIPEKLALIRTILNKVISVGRSARSSLRVSEARR